MTSNDLLKENQGNEFISQNIVKKQKNKGQTKSTRKKMMFSLKYLILEQQFILKLTQFNSKLIWLDQLKLKLLNSIHIYTIFSLPLNFMDLFFFSILILFQQRF
ncbi:unnamed protein product [Paramecium octaurelia]|uniref:Transmembrane protein n=1 Tax=Paramecium octaurelia TaxID=43137 RepID=A0A8S1T9I9_PAROT|nr:unnamed protein product [Paramecium octaurelia]